MNRPEITNEYGDLELYTAVRPLAEESREAVESVLDKMGITPELAGVDYRILKPGASVFSPLEARNIFRRTLTRNGPYQQSDADAFNEIIFKEASRPERNRPQLPLSVGAIGLYGAIMSGRSEGSQFVVGFLEGPLASRHWLNIIVS